MYNNVHFKLTFFLSNMSKHSSPICSKINELALNWRPNYVIKTALTEEFLYVFVKKLNTE